MGGRTTTVWSTAAARKRLAPRGPSAVACATRCGLPARPWSAYATTTTQMCASACASGTMSKRAVCITIARPHRHAFDSIIAAPFSAAAAAACRRHDRCPSTIVAFTCLHLPEMRPARRLAGRISGDIYAESIARRRHGARCPAATSQMRALRCLSHLVFSAQARGDTLLTSVRALYDGA